MAGAELRRIYDALCLATEAEGKRQSAAIRRILASPWRVALLLLMLLPLALPLFVSAESALPDAIGGKARFGPSFFSFDLLLSTIGIGVVAGLITGCTGAGGGFVITPALMSLGIRGILAVGTDMLHIFASSLLGTTVHRRLGNVNVRLAVAFTVGSSLGVTGGGAVNRALFERNPIASDLVISLSYVVILGFLGFYALGDFVKARRAASDGSPAPADDRTAIARRLQAIGLPPLLPFGTAEGSERRISALLVVGCGLIVGFVAAILGAGGGFLTFPMFVYLLGIPTAVTAGTNSLQVIFTAGYGGIFQYAIHGYVFYTLAMGMLLGSLVGVQLGALTTSCVHPMYIKAFYAVAILAGFVNRLFSLPDSLAKLDLLNLDPVVGRIVGEIGNWLFFALVGLLAGWVSLTLARNAGRLRARSAESAGRADCGVVRDWPVFARGAVLLGSFAVVLALLVSSLFPGGRNGLQYADDLFNSLSKGSAYFVEEQVVSVAALDGRRVDLTLSAGSSETAATWSRLLSGAGASAEVTGGDIRISGDLARILGAALADARGVYGNDDSTVRARLGLDGRQAMYAWNRCLKEAERALNGAGRFDDARAINGVIYRAIEPAYNYFGIGISHVSANVALLCGMLGFYVLYTIWYGAGMLFLFEGLGLSAGKKRVGNGQLKDAKRTKAPEVA